MATFVLVHGAWHGGWCWRDCAAALRARGHEVHAPTLTGLGERSHLARIGVDADLHVADILGVLRWRELSDVILVGHSYGGLVITGVASEAPERLRALVYLDAFAPDESGVSLFAAGNPERAARFEAEAAETGGLVSPDLFDAWTDDEALKGWLKTMCTPHPIGCFTRGVTVTERRREVAHRCYILAARNSPSAFEVERARLAAQPGWTFDEIDAKHDAMVERPDELAAMLGAYARSLPA